MAAYGSNNSDKNRRTRRTSLALAVATIVLGLIWIILSTYAVPILITRAYYGHSLPVFNQMITGQASHPLAQYLSDWKILSWHLLLALVILGLASIVVVQPQVQIALWGFSAFSPDASSPIVPLRWQRVLALNVLVGLIAGGSLYNIITDGQHWPFSNYPMYSSSKHTAWTLSTLRLYGVTQEQPLREFPLVQFQYTRPFDIGRLQSALENKINHSRHRMRAFSEAVQNCFVRYDENRRTGLNNGPPLQAMRLYRVHWILDARGRNVDRPKEKVLVVEIKRSELKDP